MCRLISRGVYRLPEDSPQTDKEDLPHNKCDREFERKRRTNVCNSADVEDLPHNGDRLGLGGLRSRGWAGGLGVPELDPNPPTLTPPNPAYHRCVVNLPHWRCCKRLSDAYVQILGHIHMSHSLCGESSLW